MDKWWHDCRDTLMRGAISLDRKIGDIEDAIHLWWTERFSAWPNTDQPMPGQRAVERAIDPAERERVDRAHRFAAMMTRGRWR
jgi:hypothetical protein